MVMKRKETQFRRLGFAALPLSFAAILLGGCFTSEPKSKSEAIVGFPGGAAPTQPAQAASNGYSLDTPIERIAADPAGAAVLNKDIPGLLANPRYEMFKSMNLKTLAQLSSGKLDEQTLAQTQADLAALPKQASLDH
jgi:hypothetical protein